MQIFPSFARCLKISEKVSFNIASEASYVYILSVQKLIKNAKNGPIWQVFENLKLSVKQCYQAGQKFKCYILGDFQTMRVCIESLGNLLHMYWLIFALNSNIWQN